MPTTSRVRTPPFVATSGNTRIVDLEEAIFSANGIKAGEGTKVPNTRLVGIGIGLQTGASVNLRAISGPVENADFILAGNENFDDLLREQVVGACAKLETTKAIATVNEAPATDQTPIPAGAKVTYQNTVANHGVAVGTTTLTETVPAHTSYIGATQAPNEGWECTPNTAEGATCTKRVEVAAGASVKAPFTVRVQSPLAGAFEIKNTVTSSNGTCPTCTVANPTTSEPVSYTHLTLPTILLV